MSSMKPINQKASIINSHQREQKKLSLRPLQSETREVVSNLIESLIGADWRASHRFDIQKDAKYLERNTYYVYKREGRERPGLLLVYSADQPAVFWDMDRDEPSAIRLQIPFGFLKNGPSLFSVTLLKGESRLIMEDVWVLYGKKWQDKAFSDRWVELQHVFKEFSVQQMFLGFDLTLVQPMSLQEFIECNPEPGSLWDFQPEAPNHKRLYWMCPGVKLNKSAGQVAREEEANVATLVAKMPPSINKNILKRTGEILEMRSALVKAHPSGLPDTYILESSDNKIIGNACVTKLQQSREIKEKIRATTTKSLKGEVVWHNGFNKYEIIKILPDDTPLSSSTAFFEANAAVQST